MAINHICIDGRMISAAGIGTYLKNLLPDLANDKRFTLTLLYHEKEKIDLPLKLIPMKSPIYSLSEQIELSIKIPSCDLFWSPHYNVPLLPIRAKKRLVTLHDVFHLAHYSKLSLPQKWYAKGVLKAAVKYSDQVVTVSDFSKSEILRYLGVKPEKIKVIHNGIRPLDSNTQDRIRKKYSLPSEFVLMVGNGKSHKNWESVFKAWDGDIVVVGEARKNFKRVRFVGKVEDDEMGSFYELASLLAFPSLYEGFGYPPLEAMSYGCPVLASNRASIPEICGDAVHYMNPLDQASIKNGILEVLSNRKELIIKGKKHWQRFKLENMVQEYKTMIYHLLDERTRE